MRISNSANHKFVLISARPTLFSVSEPPLDSLRKRHATLKSTTTDPSIIAQRSPMPERIASLLVSLLFW
jgi:hypothetical protein